jgi:phage tail tape-measure protein
MQKQDLTHVPGIVRALAGKNPDVSRGAALKGMLAHQWGAASPGQKAMIAGMTVLPMMPLLGAEGRKGPNTGEQVGSTVGSTAGALVGSALPFYAQSKVMGAGGYLGGKVGKGVDWLRGKHRSLPDDREQSGLDGQNYPGERVPMSPGSNGVMQ